MLHDYEIKLDNSKQLKDNTMLNCSMELSLLNNLFRENLILDSEHIENKWKNQQSNRNNNQRKIKSMCLLQSKHR